MESKCQTQNHSNSSPWKAQSTGESFRRSHDLCIS